MVVLAMVLKVAVVVVVEFLYSGQPAEHLVVLSEPRVARVIGLVTTAQYGCQVACGMSSGILPTTSVMILLLPRDHMISLSCILTAVLPWNARQTMMVTL
jgi:hypothetical protein